jgi:type I restriction enzyme S subunit
MTPSTSINGSVRRWRQYPVYRDSGVEWLGSVPSAWEIKQLKYAVTFQRGHDLPGDDRIEGDIPVVTSGGITSWHNCWKAKGPGIVTGRYGTVGVFHYVEADYWPHNTALYSIDLHGNSPRYLWYMLQSLSELFLLNSAKAAVPGVDRNDLIRSLLLYRASGNNEQSSLSSTARRPRSTPSSPRRNG